jgi:hypothetical protein
MDRKVPEIKLQANKIKPTEPLNDTANILAGYGVIALMESARDDDVAPFKVNWHQIHLNRGVGTYVKFGEQKTKLAKLYAEQIRALAKLYEDGEQA